MYYSKTRFRPFPSVERIEKYLAKFGSCPASPRNFGIKRCNANPGHWGPRQQRETGIHITRSIYSDPPWHSASHPAGLIGSIFQSPQIKRS
jgi:hypothetical protein